MEKNEIMIQKAKDRWSFEGLDIQLIEENVENLPCLNNSFELVLGESILAFTEKERVISSAIVYYRKTVSLLSLK